MRRTPQLAKRLVVAGQVRRVRPVRPVESLEPRLLLSAGSLDPSFGNGGELAVQFPTGQSITVVNDSLVQPDGKILVVGEANDPTGPSKTDFAIARLNPDGTPDAGFNNGTGIFVFPSPGNVDEGTGVALQSDGKIVVSGTFGEDEAGKAGYGLYAVGRFNTDGSIDTGFGDQGAVVVDFTTTGDGRTGRVRRRRARRARRQDHPGRVRRARPDPAAVSDIALARLNADGTPDATFGTGGKVLASVSGASEHTLSGALDAAGNVLVTGHRPPPPRPPSS